MNITIPLTLDKELTPDEQNTLLVNLSKYVSKNIDKLLKRKRESKVFVKPDFGQVKEYFLSKGLPIDLATVEANKFLNYFESCGWVIGKAQKPMVSWKGAVGTWMSNLTGSYQPKKMTY